ncbi:hypothetical protein SARC_00302 [Sphaeroforma arctica JP610]|uniref:Presenilin n=1 Tax=Sphaeroforma arctica JP610 TaxID=667725 RepID=A0A0L0GF45_9EUKA|nr:hypothetical protein SARC_00302 [Sphaeroforma arctica JP610]KNC87602.1 hypothetical protein SARC_00302 [Sphaeroforma arctica JP610]|eukprot:XP_014161504.1 hypothetical protein SARC_00302 [Sphaeroforma arctica JP610]
MVPECRAYIACLPEDTEESTTTGDHAPPNGAEIDDPMTMEDVHHGAGQIQALLIPVSICMMLVVITVRSITYFATNPEKQYIAYASIFKEDDGQTNYQNAMSAVGNALMLLVVVVTMTLGLVLLFKYNCYRAIK